MSGTPGKNFVKPFSIVIANVPKVQQGTTKTVGSTTWLENALQTIGVDFKKIHNVSNENSNTGTLIVELGPAWGDFEKAHRLDYLHFNENKGKEHWFSIDGEKNGLFAWFMEDYDAENLPGSHTYTEFIEVSGLLLSGFEEMLRFDQPGWVQTIQDACDNAH